ncbi:hypothetical protein CcCBS67573_g06935 [Chytriomyces confervae]|uniref:BAP29/BAP31 transmembrane domain-containing protein n=1 Tax=Chytriomyces confervae TaxID=246404 RepID=A0A507F106_9FUNG|nr:hypothetical protein HDU80_003336 [Chytriomyces hyalinus]TPX69176.1 hypothetical protein CcCBS67573_g06935 [Chytriomyces confervae]
MESLFTRLTLAVLLAEVVVYFSSLISPSFLPTSRRRAMIKSLRSIYKNSVAQTAFVTAFSIVCALFVENVFRLDRMQTSGEYADEYDGGHGHLLFLVQIRDAQLQLLITSFTILMAIVVFFQLRDKNAYIKLLEKYEIELKEDEDEAQAAAAAAALKPTPDPFSAASITDKGVATVPGQASERAVDSDYNVPIGFTLSAEMLAAIEDESGAAKSSSLEDELRVADEDTIVEDVKA